MSSDEKLALLNRLLDAIWHLECALPDEKAACKDELDRLLEATIGNRQLSRRELLAILQPSYLRYKKRKLPPFPPSW